MHTLWLLMGWPSGSVLTNLVASLLWAAPTITVAWWQARVHRHRHRAQLDEIHAAIKKLHEHHGIASGDRS